MMDKHITDLLDLYALGALEPEEQAAVDSHLDRCAECRMELERSKQVVALLAWTPDQHDPPPAVREQILGRFAAQRPQSAPARPRWRERLDIGAWLGGGNRRLALAPLALLALLLGIWNISLRQQVSNLSALIDQQRRENVQLTAQIANYDQLSALLSEPGTQVHRMQPQTSELEAANGRLLVNLEHSTATLLLSHLPQLPPNQIYQLWLMVDGQPASAGTFSVDEHGQALAVFPLSDALKLYSAAAISVEPAGGSEQPTSAPILLSGEA